MFLRKRLTLEELVVRHESTLGPVVAIGKPNEKLSPLGAARELHLLGHGWRERVSRIFTECSWVVSILGGSEGVVWEYEQVLQRGLSGRFILVIPPTTPHVFQQRWDIFDGYFHRRKKSILQLPRRAGSAAVRHVSQGNCSISFLQ